MRSHEFAPVLIPSLDFASLVRCCLRHSGWFRRCRHSSALFFFFPSSVYNSLLLPISLFFHSLPPTKSFAIPSILGTRSRRMSFFRKKQPPQTQAPPPAAVSVAQTPSQALAQMSNAPNKDAGFPQQQPQQQQQQGSLRSEGPLDGYVHICGFSLHVAQCLYVYQYAR